MFHQFCQVMPLKQVTFNSRCFMIVPVNVWMSFRQNRRTKWSWNIFLSPQHFGAFLIPSIQLRCCPCPELKCDPIPVRCLLHWRFVGLPHSQSWSATSQRTHSPGRAISEKSDHVRKIKSWGQWYAPHVVSILFWFYSCSGLLSVGAFEPVACKPL